MKFFGRKFIQAPQYITPRRVEAVSNWSTTLGAYVASAAVLLLYFSDWRVTNRYIPIYGRKFDQMELAEKQRGE